MDSPLRRTSSLAPPRLLTGWQPSYGKCTTMLGQRSQAATEPLDEHVVAHVKARRLHKKLPCNACVAGKSLVAWLYRALSPVHCLRLTAA